MATQRSIPLPGDHLPADLPILPLVGGGSVELGLVTEGRTAKLVVFYRGGFCPFCRNTLSDLQANLQKLLDADWEVLAVSADTPEVAELSQRELSLSFPIAHSLSPSAMRKLGLYVSDPTNYIPQTQQFAEPGYIVLQPDGIIKYRAEASHPMGGRPNIDALLTGFNYSRQRSIDDVAYRGHVWGAA